jgi:hypothetical protein
MDEVAQVGVLVGGGDDWVEIPGYPPIFMGWSFSNGFDAFLNCTLAALGIAAGTPVPGGLVQACYTYYNG